MNRVLQNLCNTMRQVQKLLSDVDRVGCSHQTCLLCFKLSMIDKTTRQESQSGCSCQACIVCSVIISNENPAVVHTKFAH